MNHDDDIFNEEIEAEVEKPQADTNKENESKATQQSNTSEQVKQEPQDDSVKLSKDEYESFKRMQQENELLRLDKEFKKEYADFDIKKVTDKILELDDKNPGIGARLLTHEGIENVYLKYFAGKSESADEFDTGRALGGGASIDERIAAINSGTASVEQELELYAKFL